MSTTDPRSIVLRLALIIQIARWNRIYYCVTHLIVHSETNFHSSSQETYRRQRTLFDEQQYFITFVRIQHYDRNGNNRSLSLSIIHFL